MANPLIESDVPGLPQPKRGKVRDVYDLGDKLLIVATDRISAFDAVFPTPIPDKGKILANLTLFWMNLLADVVPNHFITDSLDGLGLPAEAARPLAGRSVIAKKAEVVPFECIVRGYIIGSGWKEYRDSGKVCGIQLPAGLKLADKLPEAIFTPSTKADAGHDENVPFSRMAEDIGDELATKIRAASLELYGRAAAYARERGIIIADTKFEFGLVDGKVILIDEALTPDSSRFWPADSWTPGANPASFDKQYLRDWVERESGWNKEPPAPPLPDNVVQETRAKYIEAYERLTGAKPPL